ncbi:secretory subunit [Rhizophlyctis rosea]|uniref:Secretory subunit n=1 Tax=Rhizophlyctis rosea TaxID=64517 RepID=A0AAD5SB67_9FUNG|nr:secretory subunit [Rhizophlyctis rosea]
MAQYQYDETGAIFNYFLLAMLALALVPATYMRLFGSSKSKLDKHACNCANCQQKRKRIAALKRKDQPVISVRTILLIIGWIFFALITYKVATTVIEEPGPWDPYSILGVEENADASVVKKAYREKSKLLHPDRVLNLPEAEQAEASNKYIDLTKAMKVLTDDEAKQRWLEHKNPDGPQALQLGLALPKWLVDESNSFWVLGLYTVVFMVALPTLVAQWWNNAKNMTKDKIMHQSMARYYRDLKENFTFKPLIELLAKSEEFHTLVSLDNKDTPALEKLADEVSAAMQERTTDRYDKAKKVVRLALRGLKSARGADTTLQNQAKDAATALANKVSLLLYAHLLRIVPSDPKLADEQAIIVERSTHLIGGMLQISQSRNWMSMTLGTLDVAQAISQALYFHQSPLLQLPFPDPSIMKHFNTKKRQIHTVRDLLELPTEEQDSLLRTLSPVEKDTVLSVAKEYPLIKVTKASFSVLGEPAIIPEAIVTLTVKLSLIAPEDLEKEKGTPSLQQKDNDPEDAEEVKKEWWAGTAGKAPDAHAPFYPADKKPTWWVLMGDIRQNRLITAGKTADLAPGKDATVRLQFQAPPRPGSWDFQIFIKSDSFVGCDGMTEVKLNVQPPEAAPLIEDEDDISEPEEDSLAGQMAAMKGGAPARKGPKGEHDDSSDSDDDGDAKEVEEESSDEEDDDE